MDCEEKRHYSAVCVSVCVCECVCVQKESHEAQSMFFKVTFSTALELFTNLSLLQKLQKAADVNIRQYK